MVEKSEEKEWTTKNGGKRKMSPDINTVNVLCIKLPRSRAVELLIENHFSSRSKASGNLSKEFKQSLVVWDN